jgi:AcrR family transcriptional regulator
MSDLRTRHHEATRQEILDATQQLVVEVHGWTLSMADVAERAGVSRRTLYRYFSTKEELLEAASQEWTTERDDELVFSIDDFAPLQSWMTDQWTALADNLPAILAQHTSPQGREMRLRWLPRARRMTRGALADLPISAQEREELADLLIAVLSSSMFLELVDRMGHEPDRAAQLVIWAVQALVERAEVAGAIVMPTSTEE